MIDNSTDVSSIEQEVVYYCYLENEEPLTELLGLMNVKCGTASGIINDLDDFLISHVITEWKKKLIGLRTDRTSVNLESEGGSWLYFNQIYLTSFQYTV